MTSQLENQLEALKPRKYLAYQEGGIWYDAIAASAFCQARASISD